VIDSTRSRPQLLRDHERVFLTIESLMYAGRVHCPVLILHGGSDITVPIRSAERIANAIRSSGNSSVTVRNRCSPSPECPLPAIASILATGTPGDAAEFLGITDARFSRLWTRIRQLGKCFMTGDDHIPKQRRPYKKRVKRLVTPSLVAA